MISFFFFFNDTATTEIYTLSLHDALPISFEVWAHFRTVGATTTAVLVGTADCFHALAATGLRSEEHTSELQSHSDLVCRLLLEKKKPKRWCCAAHLRPRTRRRSSPELATT